MSDIKLVNDLLQKDHLNKTGLTSHDVEAMGTVFNPEAETVTCPACETRFKPTFASCPECGLNFG